MKIDKLNIALIVGGASPEREISKATGLEIYKSLKDDYNIKLIDPAFGAEQPGDDYDYFYSKDNGTIAKKNYIDSINLEIFDKIDLAILALHGQYGEDGVVQSLLDLRDIKYTGSGQLASALSMDKAASKILFQHFDVKTPKWFLVLDKDENLDLIDSKIKKFFGYPCIVKPNNQGSTIGLSVCKDATQLKESLNKAFKYSGKTLIEEFIDGRELTVGIIGNHTLPVLEIIPKHQIFDYDCKYLDGMSKYEVPAKISGKTRKHLQQQALLAFNSLGCKNYGRVDFRMNYKEETYCLEVNTLPGMTAHSLVPKMAEAEGISFKELIENIITDALSD